MASICRILLLVLATLVPSAASLAAQAGRQDYLYLWTASFDSTRPDFLAVLDVTDGGGDRYGRLVTTLPVPGRHNVPHHTEHAMPADRQFFANGFNSGRTWILDLRDAARPRIAADFGAVDGYVHPHSYSRLPNGNVLATFQMRHDGPQPTPGGIAEITPAGKVVRSSGAAGPGVVPETRVYSAAIVPALDRIVTTTTDMIADNAASRQLQVWRLSDLALLHTITLPEGPAGESRLTAEPRVLADGRTVLVSTFNCGLYLMDGLETDAPSARLVASLPRKKDTDCAIPVVAGNYYLITVPALNAVVSFDVGDPAAPREVSRVTLGTEDVPHWIAIAPDHRRVVITGYGAMRHRVVMARFDPATGALSLDERFREPGAAVPGYRMDDKTWPHGGSAAAVPHGAVFSR